MHLHVHVKPRDLCQSFQRREPSITREENDEMYFGDLAPTIEAEATTKVKEGRKNEFICSYKKRKNANE